MQVASRSVGDQRDIQEVYGHLAPTHLLKAGRPGGTVSGHLRGSCHVVPQEWLPEARRELPEGKQLCPGIQDLTHISRGHRFPAPFRAGEFPLLVGKSQCQEEGSWFPPEGMPRCGVPVSPATRQGALH